MQEINNKKQKNLCRSNVLIDIMAQARVKMKINSQLFTHLPSECLNVFVRKKEQQLSELRKYLLEMAMN